MDASLKTLIDTYTNSSELEEFVNLIAIDDNPYVKDRIFDLKVQELFDIIDQDVHIPTPEPMDAEDIFPWIDLSQTEPALTTDNQITSKNMQQPEQSKPTYFRPWLDQNTVQQDTPPLDNEHPGPSDPKYYQPIFNDSQVGTGIPVEHNNSPESYTFRQKGERIFAKNKATEKTFQVKFNDQWRGDKLKSIHNDLHKMFDDVLDKVRGSANDLGRIVVHHGGLTNPIVVPLQPWENLNSDVVMEGITKVLNSNEELMVDDSLEVNVGSISIPSGSGGNNLPITALFGLGNSFDRKKSFFEIECTDDHLCLPKAIGICFLKTCEHVNAIEWKERIGQDKGSTIQLAVRYRTCPIHYYTHMSEKSRRTKMQKDMATDLCKMAEVPTDRPLGLNDITPFERLLDVNVLVVSSKLGNKFVRVVNNPDLHNLFIYLVEVGDVKHFHGISSISGIFDGNYFCEACLTSYKNKESHSCETTCDVCTSPDCTTKDPMCCKSCHRECRSKECFVRHKTSKMVKRKIVPSQCQTWYQCRTCKKTLKYEERNPDDHRCGEWKCRTCDNFQIGNHFCYHRATNNASEGSDKKMLFYDFETRQDDMLQCNDGYLPGPACKQKCKDGSRCVKCKLCTNCHLKVCNPDEQCENGYKQGPYCVTTCTEESRCNKCRICINCKQSGCGLYKHVVNFVVSQSACKQCMKENVVPGSKCDVCGRRCNACWKTGKNNRFKTPPCPDTCGFRQIIFHGDEAAHLFCEYILQPQCKDSIMIAHNAKSFDLYPILEVLIDRHALRPDRIIYNGSKIMYMHIAKKMNLSFIDSLNFLPMKLSKIPETFGLTELKKGYFPHLFNRKENQSYVGPYPSPESYGHDYMSSKERTEFLKWHESKRDETFDFQKEILIYCRSDVDILRRGCLCFRGVMMEATARNDEGIDPFDYVTIAGACMGIYKSLFLEEEHETDVTDLNGTTTRYPTKYVKTEKCILMHGSDDWIPISKIEKTLKVGQTRFKKSNIGMVPSEGYVKRDNFSKASIEWLEWEAETNKIHIRHALNEGEYRIVGTNYRADGYDAQSKTVYEFLGCVFHGCKTCYPQDRSKTTHPTTDQSIEELYVITKKREVEIKRLGYRYKYIWEHQFHNNLEKNQEMKCFVSQLDIQDRLNPRDSFFGGRTNAVKLHHKVANERETIEYYDFTSLYPWTNKYCRYPVGHPRVLTDNLDVDISKYFGIAKVKILPPRNLFHPVLPRTSNGKLKFSLCGTCADNENPNPCMCPENRRAFVGTWCTPELEKAVEKGYRILKTYEVYHFDESSQYESSTGNGGLFAPYVNTFLKIKQEASGWPENCKTEEQKREYIRNYKEKEGIELEYDRIERNPGLRFLAKQCLNSFWGKFGQRLGLKQSKFIHESEADVFFQMLSDPRKIVHDFHVLTPDMLQLEWCDDPLFLPLDARTNIFIATFTTAWARLKLYSVLEEVGNDCLYMDTDSVIFVDRNRAHVDNLPIGNYLGELTNEVADKDGQIVEYVSGGPKNYAYRTSKEKEVCKVRGFTLNFTNSRLINFDAVKELVVGQHDEKTTITIINPTKICRDSRKRKLFNRKETKEYKMVYTKRRLLPDLTTLPYGF